MSRTKLTVEAKVTAEYPEFVGEVASLTADQLNARLAQLAKDRETTEQARDDDEGLTAAKYDARELGAPYRDTLKAVKLKSKYIIGLLRDKGK